MFKWWQLIIVAGVCMALEIVAIRVALSPFMDNLTKLVLGG